MFREFGARSTHFGQNGGWDESRGARVFFDCLVNHATFRELRNGRFSSHLVTKPIVRCPVNECWKTFSKIFTLGVICPQNLTWKLGQAPRSEQATGHGMHCREILFTPRCSPRARELRKCGQLFVRRTVAELRGVKVVKFSDFGIFSPYKTPKTYILPVTSLKPRGYIAEWLRFFRVVVEGPKGCLSAAVFSDRGAGDPPNLPKFSPMANGYIHT